MQKPKRKSLRLRDYDYSQPGYYFITVCTRNHACIFGEIKNDEMKLNPQGKIAEIEWQKTGEFRKHIQLDVFIIMPNHMHGIILIQEDPKIISESNRKFGSPVSNSISTLIGAYKSAVTKQINFLKMNTIGSIWQRNYYEHIIRNEKSLEEIRNYIIYNPHNWEKDSLFVGY